MDNDHHAAIITEGPSKLERCVLHLSRSLKLIDDLPNGAANDFCVIAAAIRLQLNDFGEQKAIGKMSSARSLNAYNNTQRQPIDA